jgi:amino acid permease
MSDGQVALLSSQKKRTNHILHFLLSIVTLGFWLVVWFAIGTDHWRYNRHIDAQIEAGTRH